MFQRLTVQAHDVPLGVMEKLGDLREPDALQVSKTQDIAFRFIRHAADPSRDVRADIDCLIALSLYQADEIVDLLSVVREIVFTVKPVRHSVIIRRLRQRVVAAELCDLIVQNLLGDQRLSVLEQIFLFSSVRLPECNILHLPFPFPLFVPYA